MDKNTLRQQFIKNRIEQLDIIGCKNLLKDVRVVAVYYPFKSEPSLQKLWEKAWESGVVTLLPRILPDTKMVFCPFTKDTQLTPNQYGIPESLEKPYEGKIDMIFVPGLAFDKVGTRLGYGGGYYDRFLQDKDIYKVGVCYEGEFVHSLPKETHDIQMNAVLTNEGFYPLS